MVFGSAVRLFRGSRIPCQTDCSTNRARICFSTPRTRWTGTPGATRRGRRDEGGVPEMRAGVAGLPERQALTPELLDQGILRTLSAADQIPGGFGAPPGFPQPWLVELSLGAWPGGPGGANGIGDLTL